jgi:hypothetical protein
MDGLCGHFQICHRPYDSRCVTPCPCASSVSHGANTSLDFLRCVCTGDKIFRDMIRSPIFPPVLIGTVENQSISVSAVLFACHSTQLPDVGGEAGLVTFEILHTANDS